LMPMRQREIASVSVVARRSCAFADGVSTMLMLANDIDHMRELVAAVSSDREGEHRSAVVEVIVGQRVDDGRSASSATHLLLAAPQPSSTSSSHCDGARLRALMHCIPRSA